MSESESPAAASKPSRIFRPTPAWLVLASLAVTGFLFLSEWFQWFAFDSHKGWIVLIAVAGVLAVLVVMLLWWLVALVFRLRFQYSIRSLLALTLAVALPFSWLAMEMQQLRDARTAAAAIESIDGIVEWSERPGPSWLPSFVWKDLFTHVESVTLFGDQVTDAVLESLKPA
jgi:hypothetical protein